MQGLIKQVANALLKDLDLGAIKEQAAEINSSSGKKVVNSSRNGTVWLHARTPVWHAPR